MKETIEHKRMRIKSRIKYESHHDKTKNRRMKRAVTFMAYRSRNLEKVQAGQFVRYCVKRGYIKRQPCEVCGSTDKIEAHHFKGYLQKCWLLVKWLCKKHHMMAHDNWAIEVEDRG